MQEKNAQVFGITRRQLVAGATAAVVASGFSKIAGAYAADSKPNFVPGTYASTQFSHGGNVTVEVTFSSDAIVDIQTVAQTDTRGICEKALFDELPQAIIETQSLDIDGITGATFSSNAMLWAVEDCAEQAGGDVSLLHPGKVEVDPEARELEADVVIIGGGGAGLAAAVSAVESGASVLVVEKAGYLGGNSLVNGGIYNAPNKQLQHATPMTDMARAAIEAALADEPVSEEHAALQAQVQADYDEYLASEEPYLFDSASWYALQTWKGGDYLADLALVRTMADKAYEDLKWIHELGWEDDGKVIVGAGALYQRTVSSVVPLGYGMISSYMNALEGADCSYQLNTRAEHFTRDDSGVITGLTATDTQGNTYTITARKGVVLSTGGFSGNKELIAEYNTSGKWPDLSGLGTTNIGTITGDGIKMAIEIGASLTDMDQIQLLYLCDPSAGGETARNDPKGVSGDLQLFFNKEGKRFVREDGRRDEISLAVLEQTDQEYWLVTCGDAIKDIEKTTDYSGTPYPELIASGKVKYGETFAELCEQMGIPVDVAQETLDAYNADCAAGVSPDQFGRIGMSSMTTGPWFGALNCDSIHHTMGGVTIDSECRMIAESGEAFGGLGAAGEVTGGVHGSNRLGGNAIVDTVVFGRIAGSMAAAGEL